jgi:branched-chain amino acid transport system substrate-binding protein
MKPQRSHPATVRVGVLFSQTGVTSVIEQTQLNATLLAIEEVNAAGGINGVEMQAVAYDPTSDPAQFRHLAERLLKEDGVPIIFGCYMSSARRAVVPVIEQWNALLCYPTFYEGFEYSPNVLYCGSVPNQTNISFARFLLESYGEKFYFVGSDYIFPHESNRLMRSIVSKQGGTVIGERYVPLDSPGRAFDLLIKEVKLARPNVIFSTVVGHDVAKLYAAFRDADCDARTMPIGSITTTEAEISLLPPGAAVGHVSAAPYFATVATEDNRQFVRKYQQRFGAQASPNMCAEAAYFSVFLVAQGMRQAGTADPRSLIRSLHGCQFDAPQGPVKVDAENNHAYLFSRIGRIQADGTFHLVHESTGNIKPDPYLVDYDLPFTAPETGDQPPARNVVHIGSNT